MLASVLRCPWNSRLVKTKRTFDDYVDTDRDRRLPARAPTPARPTNAPKSRSTIAPVSTFRARIRSASRRAQCSIATFSRVAYFTCYSCPIRRDAQPISAMRSNQRSALACIFASAWRRHHIFLTRIKSLSCPCAPLPRRSLESSVRPPEPKAYLSTLQPPKELASKIRPN